MAYSLYTGDARPVYHYILHTWQIRTEPAEFFSEPFRPFPVEGKEIQQRPVSDLCGGVGCGAVG